MITVDPKVALEAPSELGSAWTTNFGALTDYDMRRALNRFGERGFTTSGSTGQPVIWLRDAQQLAQESETTIAVLGSTYDAVHSTAPQESLYGYAAVLVAARLRLRYQYDRWGVRRLPLVGRHPLVFSVPAAWSTLPETFCEYFNGKTACQHRAATAVHAGARLPQRGDELVRALQLAGQDVGGIELFGSSETGVVASRAFTSAHQKPWTVVSDVDIVPNEQSGRYGHPGNDPVHLLTVAGPRVGRRLGEYATTNVSTGDLVTRIRRGQIRVVGRAGRRVKPGGHWVDLDRLDLQLQELLPGREFLTSPVDDPVWGEHVELIVDVRSTETSEALHHKLREHSGSLDVVPVRVRSDASLSRSAMGKVRLEPTQDVIATPRSIPEGPELLRSNK